MLRPRQGRVPIVPNGVTAPADLIHAMEAAPVGLVVTDPNRPDNPVTYVNQEFSAITGYAADEILGRNLRLLQGADSAPEAIGRMREAVAKGLPTTAELLNYRKSGEPFFMRVEIRPVFAPDGRLTAFVGGLTDLTPQIDAQQKLAESQERLQAVMAAIPLPMLTLSMDGTISRANPAAHEALGVPPDSLPGASVYDFVLADEVDPGRRQAREMLEQSGRIDRVEMRARRSDGQVLWVLLSAQQFTSRGETRTLAIFQDVTALKRKERELQEANEEAERNIRARMRFLAAASHDLRQPLQAMALFASALDHHVSSPQGRTIVQSLKTSLRGMEEMFDSLLDMSKLDAGVMKAEIQDFLVGDVFEQLEMNYGPQAQAAGLELRVVPSSAALRSDPRLLARILGNFLSNAIRYTRRGKVLMGVRRAGDRARVVVCDTGPGIPENKRLEIFREFTQAAPGEPRGRGAGMGLGLAIVQRLARLLGHPLDVRSSDGKGTAFAVEIPLAEGWSPAAEAAEDYEDLRDVAGAVVAVVDDDREIQEGLGMLLEEWGCRPVVAATSREAIAVLDRIGNRPDVILADLHLRGSTSGAAVIEEIRAHTGQPVPAFLFTGDTEAAAAVTGGDTDVQVLRKPLDPLRLRTMLADALGR